MGWIVTFAQLPASSIAAGITSAPITKGETREMAAELIRIAGALDRNSAPRIGLLPLHA